MAAPSQFDYALKAIYDAALDPDRWPDALQAAADCTDDVGAILIYGRDDGSFGVIGSPSLDAVIEEYRGAWSLRDIRANRTRERGYFINRGVLTDRDVVSVEEIETDPFYCEYLRRHGLKYFAASIVSPDPRVEVGVSVQRAVGLGGGARRLAGRKRCASARGRGAARHCGGDGADRVEAGFR
jgi:hypothetical protein